MRRPAKFLRCTYAAAGAALAAGALVGGGCLRDRHLVGESFPDGASAAPDAGRDNARPQPSGDAPGTVGPPAGTDGGVEVGATVTSLGDKEAAGWPIAIPPEEVARRLSQLLLRKAPSGALTAAVIASAPLTNQDVGQLADGILLQDASVAGRQAFYRWWLGLDDFLTVVRDPVLFPRLTTEIRQALIDQSLMFVEDITWRPDGNLSMLLSEPSAYVTAGTAPWFTGVAPSPTGTTPLRVGLDGNQHAGLITQPAVLSTTDYSKVAAPGWRGLQLRRRYLCQSIPPEPSGGPEPQPPTGMTIRQSLEIHATSSACAVCHVLVDPPGFAFGHFDAVGAFQQAENGLAVDTTGTLVAFNGAGADRPFDGAPALAKILVELPQVRTCYAAKWLAFATGRFATSTDQDALSATAAAGPLAPDADYVVRRATIQGQLHLRGTIRAVTETHTFLDP